ncbi:hypothetical protein [Actinoplanes utahensis]|uniref:Uncharacterized protein n=1 Tax=Actinoplanes utahensis TaxID=1869 RepID=A0A0A6USH5_ACTUT|nr:hypothetical protein [Actinoplanes utahensis]KHD77404.1 hypothetical protein MB27_11755 [Actinoplanes utahensis]GIF32827.1 hypothetical protein Aut01nite_58130 [Actinoplanes utahensis]
MSGCPVCLLPGDTASCARCGWTMRGPLLLGGADPATAAAFDRELRAASGSWDTAAAHRACEDHDLAAYGPLLRGPGSATVPEHVPPPPAVAPADLSPLLTRLVTGALPVLHFVEFTPDAAVRVPVTADRAGVPVAGSPVRLPWSTAVLGGDPVLRRFRLAGGVGRDPLPPGAFDDAVQRVLHHLPPGAGDTVLVDRHPGWVLLDHARRLAREQRRPVAELTRADAADPAEPLPTTVARLLRQAPLAYDYVLLGSVLDTGSGRVDLVPLTLFPAGTIVPAGKSVTRTVTLHGPPVAAESRTITVPVLARRGGQPADWPVLALPHTEIAEHATATLQVRLTGPGAVTCDNGTGPLRAGDPGSLHTGLRARTVRLPAPPPLDLACLIELCGGADPAEVRARLDLLLHTLDLVTDRYARRGGLRVAALGYFDHVYSEAGGDPRRELVRPVEFGAPPVVRAAVSAWRPARKERDYVTALGDALARVRRLRWRRDDPAVRRAVLVIGRRPPEPRAGTFDLVPRCPNRIDWQVESQRLRQAETRMVARIDVPAGWPGIDRDGRRAAGYAEQAWRALAADGLLRADGGPAEAVELLRLAPEEPGKRIFPFPFLVPPGTGP